MKKHEALEKKVEAILESARIQLETLAAEYRESTLLPFCRRHQLTYIAGMGMTAFYRNDESIDRHDFPLLAPIQEALDIGAIGRDDCLGYYIADIKEADIARPRSRQQCAECKTDMDTYPDGKVIVHTGMQGGKCKGSGGDPAKGVTPVRRARRRKAP